MGNTGLGLCGCHNGNLGGILKAAFQSVQARSIKPIVVRQNDFQIRSLPQIKMIIILRLCGSGFNVQG
jgi:hypothetical protein